MIMELLDVVLAVEQGTEDHTEEEIIEAIGEHRETLRRLQGSWGRLVASLEERELI